MSKFLRTMTALSKKPSDYKRSQLLAQELQTGTVPEATTVPNSPQKSLAEQDGTVPVIKTVPETPTVPEQMTPTSRPRVRVFRATRVQDGHSLGEHLIYEVLWRQGQGDDQARTVQIGYDRLAALAVVNWKTAKTCLKSLEEKLAIETIGAANSNERTGKTYRIHCFTAILERRRAAGLQWVEKGRGVRFIESGTVPVITTVVPESTTVPEPNTVPEAGTRTVLKTGTDTVPATGTPLGSLRNIEEITSSSAVATLQQAAADNGILLDDDAARKLIRRCRTAREDISDAEIALFTQVKINQLRNSKTVENWVGMLIASVPAYFEGDAAQLIRLREQGIQQHEAEQAEAEAKQRELAALLETQQRILNDPESSDEDKTLARKILGL